MGMYVYSPSEFVEQDHEQQFSLQLMTSPYGTELESLSTEQFFSLWYIYFFKQGAIFSNEINMVKMGGAPCKVMTLTY